ncbi:MAG: CusA/CzcA family heavy metal efflux RND transporter, partial [Nitrospirales bacterium]
IGGFVKQYQVQVDPVKLQGFGIGLPEVIRAVRRSNNEVGGRVIEASEREYMVRGRGYIQSLDDIRTIPLGTDHQGTPITIRDVATVVFGPDLRRGIAELNGKGETVGGIVVMRYGENALEVIQRVKEKLKEITPSMPEGIRIVPVYDRSSLILRAIATLQEKLIEISIVVSVICLLFLFHLRSALVPILLLPVAILLSFIAMYYIGVTSNVMSLAGIAIAIGAMVDAAIVMVENAHRRLEEWEQQGRPGSRDDVIIQAAREVGKPLFYSLLIITVSFLPILTLEAQEGRLFKPLAYTKSFAMFFAALVSIGLAPLFMKWFIRGRIRPERRNPLNRFLIWAYTPMLKGAVRARWGVVVLAVIAIVATIPIYNQLGSEFMPPLNEGTILFMPTSIPGMSIQQASKILQTQDRLLKEFPEVDQVMGKMGRARTATDPAPLNMTETIVTLKPADDWRPGMTWDTLIAEMDQKVKLPGMPNIWWMPIQTRTEMLATGIRTSLGIRILGPQLEELEKIGLHIERLLQPLKGTRSAYAERVTGGYYLDIDVDRVAASRYGLTVGDVQDVIESAIGGKNIAWTVEGRERYPINVRYPRDLRQDAEALKRILVTTAKGEHIPLAQLARISTSMGPPSVRDENGSLASLVFVDIAGQDLGTYVQKAKELVQQEVKLPPGYSLQWAGQYTYLERAREKLKIVVPLTLFLIFFLLYLNFHSVPRCLLILLTIPFSLVGAIWYVHFLNYDLSIAVWIGMIALAGVAVETGIIMIIFLDEACARRQRENRLQTLKDLREAILEGAVLRVRPKIMTASAIMLGLLPIMWSQGTGADVMKRIAAPMIGGMVSATILTLLVLPALYLIWKKREIARRGHNIP